MSSKNTNTSNIPDTAPPSYDQATGSSADNQKPRSHSSYFLEVPNAHNGIPAPARRSMEDEQRPLPAGWVRQFDHKQEHQFFVDTKANPPRSIWHHPYDDEDYLRTLSSEERERIQEAESNRKVHFDTTDDESDHKSRPAHVSGQSYNSTTGSTGKEKKPSFAGKLKDKVTGMTKEERQADRVRRDEEERVYYEAHLKFRTALQRAQMTGQPQFLGKDRDGKDVYVEPPPSMYGGRTYGGGGYGYNPYAPGLYSDPNVRFIRPQAPYGRPYGRGYGGGMGMPIAGGLMGGMLLGGLLF